MAITTALVLASSDISVLFRIKVDSFSKLLFIVEYNKEMLAVIQAFKE